MRPLNHDLWLLRAGFRWSSRGCSLRPVLRSNSTLTLPHEVLFHLLVLLVDMLLQFLALLPKALILLLEFLDLMLELRHELAQFHILLF